MTGTCLVVRGFSSIVYAQRCKHRVVSNEQDSGVVTPAAAAADPNYDAEFVRNTLAASRGGLINALKKPIR